MPTLGKQLEVYEAPQLTLHINMSVTLRLLADIEEWTYSTPYSIRSMLVLQGFAGTCGLTPTPAYFNIAPARTIRIKSQKNMFICICGLSLYLRQLKSACAQMRFHCMTNRIIISFLRARIN